jgi:hypothetical protein
MERIEMTGRQVAGTQPQEGLVSHLPTPVAAIAASESGALAGFESRCSCGLAMRNTIRTNVELDVAEHLRYFDQQRAGRRARR